MWQPTLLKLNGVDMAASFPKAMQFADIMQNGFGLQIENSCHQIWTISSSLPWQECFLDFWPLRVGSNCNKQISCSKSSIDSHGVLTELEHTPGSTNEGRGKDSMLSNIPQVKATITCILSINQAIVEICTKFTLTKANPFHLLLLNMCPGINRPLLEKPTSQMNSVRFSYPCV